MRLFTRLIIILALGWLGYVLFGEARTLNDPEHSDPTKLMVLFAAVILIALVIGTILTLTLVPLVAERVGGFFYNPGEKVEKDRNADAIVKIAHGDYEGAIAEYARLYENDPSDTHALSEMANIYCNRIGDNEAAAAVLYEALQREWPAAQSAFLASRLAEIYWDYQRNPDHAIALLAQIVQTVPGTKYAANATHRIHEIERAVALGHLPPAKGPVSLHAETPGAPEDGEV